MIPFIDHIALCSSYGAHPAHPGFLFPTSLSTTIFGTLLRSWNDDLLCYIYRRPSAPDNDNTWQIGVAWQDVLVVVYSSRTISFVLFFSLVFGGVLGSVFLRFGRRNVPNGGYLGTLSELCCSKAGKLKTSVSSTPNTTFLGFEGLGQDVLCNFFQHLFWDGF